MFYCLTVGSKELTERSAVLTSLSQTCKAYRQIFLPMLWEKLEAFQCTDPNIEVRPELPEWQQKITSAIVRQLETVTIRDPALADHVQCVHHICIILGLRIEAQIYLIHIDRVCSRSISLDCEMSAPATSLGHRTDLWTRV